MKNKKKIQQVNSIKLIKLINTKYSEEPQKTVASTKEKTFATIEENQESLQTKYPTARLSLKNRLQDQNNSYFQRMQTNNISPFSDDQKSLNAKLKNNNRSQSPKLIKICVNKNNKLKQKKPRIIKEVDIKKNNKNANQVNKKQLKEKQIKKIEKDKDKDQIARKAFQNQFLVMMKNKKITQESQEDMEGSIRRKKRISFNNNKLVILTEDTNKNPSKHDIARNLQIKLKKKYEYQHPQLEQNQLKLMVALGVIQILWRQKKVKQVISQYVTPKSSPQSSFRESFNKQNVRDCRQNKQQRRDFQQNLEQRQDYQQNNIQKQNSSRYFLKKKSEGSAQDNLQQNVNFSALLQQNSILSVENQNQKIINQNADRTALIKFVECYRQAKLNYKKKSKTNVFNLKQSLSQKCLMQKYYGKLFLDKSQVGKSNKEDMFSHFQHRKWNNSNQQNNIKQLKIKQERALQKLSEITNKCQMTSKSQIASRCVDQEVWVRSQTHQGILDNNSDELILQQPIANYKQTILVKQNNQFLEKQNLQNQIVKPLKQHSIQQVCSLASVKLISQTSQKILSLLLNQFSIQYKKFNQIKCLTKKKKSKMPCFQIDGKLIEIYLQGLIKKILQQNKANLLRSLNIFDPFIYLKNNRIDSPIYNIFQYQYEEENYFWQIMTIQSYMQYQDQYQRQNLKFTQQQNKYINFNQVWAKIVNRCIYESFQNQLNAYILDLCPSAWFTTSKINQLELIKSQIKQENIQNNRQSTIMKVIQKVKIKVLKDTKVRLFPLHYRNNDLQQIKQSKVIREQYDQVGQQWTNRDKIYELNLEISQLILISLFDELEEDLQKCNYSIME